MKNLMGCVLAIAMAGSMAACAGEVERATEHTEEAESALTCTPGEQMCDWGCYYVGGPSSSDCIIRCNAAGNGFIKVQDCGWAQNFPYSSSCRDRPAGPVCEWN